MDNQDLITLVDSFNQAWNNHDANAVAEFFSEDGYIQNLPPPPDQRQSVWKGKDQIRGFAQAQMDGFHVDAQNYQVTENKVTWDFKCESNIYRTIGVNPSYGKGEAVIENGKIKSFIITFNPETIELMKKAFPKVSH